MQLLNEILNFGEEKQSFLTRLSIGLKRFLLYFSGLRSTIYVMVCYYILKKEPEEFELLRKVVYFFFFVNIIDFVLRKTRPKTRATTAKLVSVSLHITAIIILVIVLKKTNISIKNFTLLKHFVTQTIKENTTPTVKIKKLLPFILFPILLINSVIEALKDYIDFDDTETLKKYYNTFTGKINVEEYFKDIPIYKKILSNSFILLKSIKEKNSVVTGLLLLNQVFNCIDINIMDKKNNLLMGSIYKILVDFYVLVSPILEIVNQVVAKNETTKQK